MKPRAKAALVLLTYVVGLNLFFLPAQEGMLISIDGLDVLIMLGLVLPFLAARWLSPSQVDATRIAWYLTAVMALDIIFFAVMAFAPTSGHPTYESLGALVMGLLKVLLAPAALVALSIAIANGERAWITALGLICVIAESVFTLTVPYHPFHFLLVRLWREGVF